MLNKVSVIFILIFVFSGLFNSNIEAKITQVSLVLPWKHQFQFAGYYAAIEKGYYKDLGFSVDIKEYDLKRDNTLAVATGKAQFGIGHSSLIFDMLKKYNNIVLLAAIHQSSPLILLTKKQAAITRLEDFSHKKIMMTSDQSFTASINAMLNSENLKTNSFDVVETSFNPIDLINGYADLMVAYSSNEPYTLKEKGIEYTIFDPKDYGYDFYSDILFTSDEMLKNNPEMVNAFYEATIKGWKYAYGHIEETAQIILNKYNTQGRNLSALVFEAQVLKQLALKKGVAFGFLDPIRLREMANTFRLLDLVKVTNVDFKKFIYQPESENKILLTDAQKNYLLSKEKIKLCVIEDNMPFEGLKQNQIIGITADFLSLIKKNIDIPFSYLGVADKLQAMSYLQQKKCDIVPVITHSESINDSIIITKPYFDVPLTLVTLEEIPFIYNSNSFLTKFIGVLKGQHNHELEKLMKIHILNNMQEGLEQLKSKQLYGLITDLLTYKKMQQQQIFGQLHFAHKLEQNMSVHFAIHSDEKELFNIIEKQISSITESNKSQILEKWLSTEYIKSIDSRLVWLMIGLVLFIILMSYFINLRLKKMVQIRTDELNQQLDIFDQHISASRTDKNGAVTYVSKEFCRLSGYSKEELIGKTLHLIKDKESNKELYQDLCMTINSGHSWKGEIKNFDKEGKACWNESIISPIFNLNGSISGFETIYHKR